MAQESPIRSLLKGITWRFLATGILVTIIYFVEGTIDTALKVGAVEFFLKFLVYFLHERFWSVYFIKGKKQTPSISFKKSISWRIVASLMTWTLALIFLEKDDAAFVIVAIEFVTKFIAYYLHERAWQILPLGTIRRFFKNLIKR